MSEQHNHKDAPLSTTVVGLQAQDGVVICADRQVSGKRMWSTDKLKQIHPNAVMGTAGRVTDIQTLVRKINTGVKEYRIRRGRDMTVNALMEYIRNEVNPGSGLALPDYLSSIVVVGYDEQDGIVTEFGFFGTRTTGLDYVTVGSGGPVARGVISSDYDPELSVEEAKKLGIKSLRVAASEGVYTGVGIDVAVLDEDGVKIEKGVDIE